MTSHTTPFVVHLQSPDISAQDLFDSVGVGNPNVIVQNDPDTFYDELHRRDEFLLIKDWDFQHDALVLTLWHARDVYALLRLVENANVMMTIESENSYVHRQYA